MTYNSPQALRTALEARIRNESIATGISADRLRRRVIFRRIVARLQRAEPGRWVLKGGMALEVRLLDSARLTKDIDLGLRDEALDGRELRDRLVDDLVDVMLLRESGLLFATQLARATTVVWAERDSTTPPRNFPDLPSSWPERYERLAAENDVEPPSFFAAAARAAELSAEMFPTEEI